MIIATKKFDMNKITSLYQDREALREYIVSLVPPIYRHTSIVSNQIFYVNSIVLKDETKSMDFRKEISKALLHNIKVCGVINQFIEISAIERRVNKNKINKYYEGEKK